MTTTVDLITQPRVIVQTARSLPSSNAGWTTQGYLRFESGSEGCGQILGEARLVQDLGVIKAEGAPGFASIGLAPDINRSGVGDDLVGLVVRLVKRTGTGTSIVDTAFWWGIIQSQIIEPDLADSDNAGGQAVWTAVGLACVLDGIALTRGWILSGSSLIDPGYLPPFNRQPGGDRSASTTTINGQTAYAHVLADVAVSNQWTAAQILAHLLAGFAQPTVNGAAYGWQWALSVVGACLNYVPEDLDLGGLSLLQALNALASNRRGVVWTLAVSGSTATITVQSAADAAYSVGGFTLPASNYTATLAAAGDRQIQGLQIAQDESATADIIEVRASCPWVSLSLAYPDHLEKGWPGAVETEWASHPQYPAVEQAWRRFTIRSDWDQRGVGGSGGLQNTLTMGPDGLTGARSSTTSADRLPGFVHVLERMLSCGVPFDNAGVGPRQAPIVVMYDGAGSYADMSLAWTIDVQNEPAAIRIDDGENGAQIQARLAPEGAKLYVSLGIREHQPLRVSWQRSPGDWPRATPRVKLIQLAGVEHWRTDASLITGVSGGGVVIGAVGTGLALATAGTVRNGLPVIQAVLALARAWFSRPSYQVRWTQQGELDVGTTYAPARLLTSVQLGDNSMGVYSVITRRSWAQVQGNGAKRWDTTYQTERVLPDVEGVV